MKTSRTYVQTRRADAAEAARLRVLDAFVELVLERASIGITLAEVAERAGVTVQTILRKFGSRDALFDEAMQHGQEVVTAERTPPSEDIPGALRVLVDHYERRGRAVLALLASESTSPKIGAILDNGRATHRAWVEDVFADAIAATAPADRDELVRLLIVATDVYAWKLLRQDQRLSRSDTERHLLRLVGAVLSPTLSR